MTVHHQWQYEQCGDIWFRVAPCLHGGQGWIAEAKREPFEFNSNCLYEKGPAWFEFGDTRDETLRKLKAEVLS